MEKKRTADEQSFSFWQLTLYFYKSMNISKKVIHKSEISEKMASEVLNQHGHI